MSSKLLGELREFLSILYSKAHSKLKLKNYFNVSGDSKFHMETFLIFFNGFIHLWLTFYVLD